MNSRDAEREITLIGHVSTDHRFGNSDSEQWRRQMRKLQREGVCTTTFDANSLDQRGRPLRDVGIIPKGAYGRHSPDIAPEILAQIVLGLAADKPRGAALAAGLFAKMVQTGEAPEAKTFGEAITEILSDVNLEIGIEEVRLNRSWPEAVIVFEDGLEIVYAPEDRPETGYGAAAQLEIVLSAGFLHQLAIELSEPSETGEWTAEV